MSVNDGIKSISWILFTILIICATMSAGVFVRDYYSNDKERLQKERDSVFAIIEDSLAEQMYARTILQWDNVDYWLLRFKIKHPEIVRAQIIIECGWALDSRKAIQDNNILGLKKPFNRLTTCDYEINGHCGYSTFMRCLKDYSLFQESNYFGGDYYDFLSRIGYAEDKEYINKLKQIVYKLNKDTL